MMHEVTLQKSSSRSSTPVGEYVWMTFFTKTPTFCRMLFWIGFKDFHANMGRRVRTVEI
jgi:hypothetical protein